MRKLKVTGMKEGESAKREGRGGGKREYLFLSNI